VSWSVSAFDLIPIYQLSGDIATRQMQVCASRDAFTGDLAAGCRPERGFELLEIGKAGLRRRIHTQQRPKGAPVYRANCTMVPDREDQGFDIVAPAGFLFQVKIPSLAARAAASAGLLR
jgi:hypothetical protein